MNDGFIKSSFDGTAVVATVFPDQVEPEVPDDHEFVDDHDVIGSVHVLVVVAVVNSGTLFTAVGTI